MNASWDSIARLVSERGYSIHDNDAWAQATRDIEQDEQRDMDDDQDEQETPARVIPCDEQLQAEQDELPRDQRVEDAIIDAHNAPRGMQFQIASRHTDVLPMNAAPFYRVYFSIPDCNITGYNSHEYLDALTAAQGAIFCGSPYATIEFILGNVYTQELVQAVS